MLDDIRLTLYQSAVNLHIKFCHNTYFKIEIRKKYSVVSLPIKYGCAATLRPLALYVPFRPYTTKAHSYLGALVVVF